jgi:hypothetical protein
MDVNDLLAKLKVLFAYDAETGVVTRLVARGNRAAGSKVGTRNTHGHLGVQVDGRHLGVHQVAWALHHGKWPNLDIDHRNGAGNDNRIANLRLATDSQNLRNSRNYAKKSGLPRGVTRSRRGYVARITTNPGNGASYLGTFETPTAASAAYQAAAQQHFGEFRRNDAR